MPAVVRVSNRVLPVPLGKVSEPEGSLSEVDQTLNGFSSVLGNTSGVLEGVSQILAEEFIGILNDTAAGMEGLERTSRLIDNTLAFISAIPFIGGNQYQPEIPLAQSVANIRRDLEGMPPAMREISSQLRQTAGALQPLPTALDNLAAQLTGIRENLAASRQQLDEYRLIIESYQAQLEGFQKILPNAIAGLYAGLSLLLVWIGLAQIGLFTQGLERLGKAQPDASTPDHKGN